MSKECNTTCPNCGMILPFGTPTCVRCRGRIGLPSCSGNCSRCRSEAKRESMVKGLPDRS